MTKLKIRRQNIVRLVVVTLQALAIGAVLVATATAGPGIDEYTIYGEHGVFLGASSQVFGLVGARDGTLNSGWAVKLNGAATISGDARSGANVNLQNNADILGTLFLANTATLTTNSGNVIGAIVVGDPELPVFPSATDLSVPCATGGTSFTGTIGDVTVFPGVYGIVKYSGKLTMSFAAAGDYYFKSISGGGGSRLIVEQPGVRVYVCDGFKFNGTGGVRVSPDSLSPCAFSVEVQTNDWHNAFQIAGGSSWIGDVFAPFGGIHLGNQATIRGQLVGQFVDLEHGVVVTNEFCGGCACVTDFTPTAGAGSTAVTVKGTGLENVTEVRFSTSCDPTTGVAGSIVPGTQTSTQLVVTAPVLPGGTYHLIAICPSGSFCTQQQFTTGP